MKPTDPVEGKQATADRQWDEYCVYCGKTKGEHFGPANDPACYQGNPFGRRFRGKEEFAPIEEEKMSEPTMDEYLAGLSLEQRIAVRVQLMRAGLPDTCARSFGIVPHDDDLQPAPQIAQGKGEPTLPWREHLQSLQREALSEIQEEPQMSGRRKMFPHDPDLQEEYELDNAAAKLREEPSKPTGGMATACDHCGEPVVVFEGRWNHGGTAKGFWCYYGGELNKYIPVMVNGSCGENGLNKVFGTWPGNETDEQLLSALDEVRKPELPAAPPDATNDDLLEDYYSPLPPKE